jgi:hypothetical protein
VSGESGELPTVRRPLKIDIQFFRPSIHFLKITVSFQKQLSPSPTDQNSPVPRPEGFFPPSQNASMVSSTNFIDGTVSRRKTVSIFETILMFESDYLLRQSSK